MSSPAQATASATEPLYSVTDAAKQLGVSPNTLRRWDALRIFSPMRTPGGQRRYSTTQINEFITRQQETILHHEIPTSETLPVLEQTPSNPPQPATNFDVEALSQKIAENLRSYDSSGKSGSYKMLFVIGALFAILFGVILSATLDRGGQDSSLVAHSDKEGTAMTQEKHDLFAGLESILGSWVNPEYFPVMETDLLRSENVRIFDKLSIGTPNPVRITSGVVSSKYALTLGSGTGTIYLFNDQNTVTEEGNLSINGTLTSQALITQSLQLSGDLYADVLRGNDGNLYLNGTSSYVNSAGVFTGNGSALTSLNADNITSGKLNNDRLNSDVSKFGDKVDSGEIQDGTIQKADIGADTIDLDNIADTLPLDNSLEFTLRDYSFNLNANGTGNVTTHLNGTGSFRVLNSSGTALFTVAPGGNTTLGGNFLPSTDATYDLGSSTQQWNNLYLAGGINGSGTWTISNSNPTIAFVDTTTGEDDWNVNVDGSSFYIRNTTDGSNYLSLDGAGSLTWSGAAFSSIATSTTTFTLPDNLANAFDLQETTNNYINVNTTNSSEAMQFGNATTNPSFSFLGTGAVTIASTGGLIFSGVGGDITFTNGEKIDNDTDGTLLLTAPATSLSGDLTVTGNDITFGNGESISNATDATISLNPTTLLLSGTTTLTASSLTLITGGATAIDFTEFDVSASTGSVTINDTADAGSLTVEGTVLDINSLDFVGAGTVSAASTNALTLSTTSAAINLTTTTSGNIVLTTGAATGLVNVLTGNLKVGNGSPTNSQDGEDFYVEGILEVDGTAYLDGAVFNGSNVTFGDASSDTITFTGRVNSSINPSSSSTYDLGSASLKWNNVYAANGNFDNISGVVTGGSTTSATWTINSDNATSNAEISAVVFETNSTFDANMRWVASGDSSGNRYGGGYDNTITSNYPFSVISEVSGGNTSLTGGSLFNYGQNATHAMTQASAFVGLDVDFSSNVTVPNSSSGNQTGALVTIKDGGASATAIGFQTAGTFDYGLDIGGTPGTADIRLSNAETILNTVNGTITFAIDGTGEVGLTSAALSPSSSDGTTLGTTSLMWSDLFLASGGVINFNNGNITLTHSTGLLAIAGGDILLDNNENLQWKDAAGTARGIISLESDDILRITNNSGADGGDIVFRSETGGGESARITTAGNLGIGDTTPDAQLETLASFYISEVADGDGDILSVTNTGTVFNEDASDRDFRIESDTNENAFVLDAGLFSGVGQLSIGSAAQGTGTAAVVFDNPAISAVANQNFYKVLIDNSAAATIPAGTAAIAASLAISEPNLTATGTITIGTSLYVEAAPTEGSTDNFAAWIDNGDIRADGHMGLGGGISTVPDTTVFSISEAYTGTSSFLHQDIFGYLAPASNNANTFYALRVQPILHSASTANITGTMIGIAVSGQNADTASSIANMHGVLINNPTSSGGAITSNSGITIAEQTIGATNDTNLLIGTTTIPTGTWSIYNSSTMDNYFAGNIGIGDTGPDAELEVLGTTEQLRLTYTDTSVDARFTVNSTGDLTIDGSADGTGSETFTLTGYSTFTLTDGTAFACTDCLDFADMEDSLDVDAATDINLGTVALTIDMDSTGDFSIRDGTTDILAFTDSGAITATPTSGQNFAVTAAGAGAINHTTATGSQTFTSSVVSTSTTSSGFVFDATAITSGTGAYLTTDSITTGRLFDIATSGNTLTSGRLFNLATTATSLTGTAGIGSLMNLDWTPGSATTATGDLFAINIGTNGTTTGNLFNILDASSSIFSVSETAFTTSLPTSFNSPGDVGIAYDLMFTNQTASFIKSNAPLTIEVGESFESNDLTLKTYNQGTVVVDNAVTTGTILSIPNVGLTTGSGLNIAHTTSVIASGGSLARISSTGIDTGTTTGVLLDLSSTASTAGTQFLQTYSALTTGVGQSLTTAALTTGSASRVTGSGASMLTGGELIDLVLGATTVGAGLTVTSTGTYTGTGSADGMINVVANSLSTGDGSKFSFTGLTSGTGIEIIGGTSMTTGGELLDLNMGAATAGNGINITTTGVYTGTGLAVMTANSATTGDIFNLSATGLTTGSAMVLTGPTSTGVTDGFVKITADVGASVGLLHLTPDFSGSGVTSYGIWNTPTDATANANTGYGYRGELILTGNAAKIGYGIYQTVTSSSTTADTLTDLYLDSSVTGIITSGTRNVYGVRSALTVGAESTGGTTNVYGVYSNVTADVGAGGTVNGYGLYVANGTFDTDGTSAQYGLHFESLTGADTNIDINATTGLEVGISGTNELGLNASALYPYTTDGNALGTATNMWADLFLASGGVVNFDNGDVTQTHAANSLAFAGASSGYSFDDVLTISGTETGAILNITNADAGALGVRIISTHNSASPAASDEVLGIYNVGEDSAGNSVDYGQYINVISDPTDTTEDSYWRWKSMVAGTLTTLFTLDGVANALASGSLTVTGAEGSNQLVVTAGDVAISDGSAAIIDDDNAASFSVTNNTATTIGAAAATGLIDIASTSLTTGTAINIELTEGTLSGGHYLKAWDVTAGATVFSIGEDGKLVVGEGSGTDSSAAPTFAGTARPTKMITLSPEYPGAVPTAFYGAATDSDITGNMTSDAETTLGSNIRTYYQWERTTDTTQHMHTVAVRVKLPKDFSAWATSNALQISYITEHADDTSSELEVRIYNEADATIVDSITSGLSETSWSTATFDDTELDDGSNEWDAADETAVIYLRMASGDSKYVRVGDIVLTYLSAF